MFNGWSLFLVTTSTVAGMQIYNALVSTPTLAEKKNPTNTKLSNRSFVTLAELTKRKSNENLLKQSSSQVSFGLYQIDEEEDDYAVTYNNHNQETIPRTDSRRQLTSNRSSQRLIRNESEMSLGLNRTNSFANHVMELGEFCPSGQIFITIARYSFIATAATAILYYQLTAEPMAVEETVTATIETMTKKS